MNPIVAGIGKKALDLFYKKFGRRIIKTAADSKWLANTIRLLKQKAHKPKASDVAQRVREKMLKDKPFQGFTPKVVPKVVKPKIAPKKPNPLKDILEGKTYIDKGPKGPRIWGFEKIPHPKGPGKVIKFPKPFKKPPGKADGGRIDKALPGRSRDI